MKTGSIAVEGTYASSTSNRISPLIIWLIPLLYPISLSAIDQSADWVRAGELIGGVPVFAAGILWALAGPFAAWLTLDYLDRNGLERRDYRFAVYGALLAAANPPIYIFLGAFMGRLGHASLKLPTLYLVDAFVAAAALLPASEPNVASVAFRRIHGYSAVLIVSFAAVHLFNHLLALNSLNSHVAFMRVFRLVYRERLIEIGLVGSVVIQASTGFTMVWKSRLRRTTTFRNLQTVSGIYMFAFFVSHLFATFSARQRGVDTTFSWATNGPAGLLAHGHPAALLPYYTLAVVMLFVHLACQARRNLTRTMSEAAARKFSYGLMMAGGIVSFVIALAACGIHLKA